MIKNKNAKSTLFNLKLCKRMSRRMAVHKQKWDLLKKPKDWRISMWRRNVTQRVPVSLSSAILHLKFIGNMFYWSPCCWAAFFISAIAHLQLFHCILAVHSAQPNTIQSHSNGRPENESRNNQRPKGEKRKEKNIHSSGLSGLLNNGRTDKAGSLPKLCEAT